MNRFGEFLALDKYPKLSMALTIVIIAVAAWLWFTIATTDHDPSMLYFAAVVLTILGLWKLWKRRDMFKI